MQSMQKPKPTDDPHDVLVVAPDAVKVAPDAAKVAPALAKVAAAHEEFFSLAPDELRAPSGSHDQVEPVFLPGVAVPPVDPNFRATSKVNNVLVKSRGRSMVKQAMRAGTALLLAASIGGAAAAWRYHAEEAQQIIAEWAPLFARKSSQPAEKSGLSAPPVLAAADADAQNTSPAQPVPEQPAPQAPTAAATAVPAAAAITAPAAAAPAATEAAAPAAAVSADRALETMARDLANAGQEIDKLKATVEQLKASQQQLVAMVSEKAAATQTQRSKKPASPPRPGAELTPPRRPIPQQPPSSRMAMPSSAAAPLAPAAATYVPRQVEPQTTAETLNDPELVSVPRPPMPLR